MKYLRYIVLALCLTACLPALSQTDRHEVRKGNREFRRGDWRSADISYRKALLKDSTSFAANYNLAANQYRQGNAEEAAAQMGKIAQAAPLSPAAADYYFNAGDYALALKDWNGAIEAFRQVLLRHPDDMEAKENLAYAQKMMQDEEQNQDQDKDNQDQDNQDQNQDQDQDRDNQDQDQDQNQDQDNRDQNQDREQRQDRDVKISPQQAQQMLQAIQAREKETQEKVKKAEAEAVKSRQKEKNW